MERLLRDLEYFATMASIVKEEYHYPRCACSCQEREFGLTSTSNDIEEMWQDTMLNQFHDVLPGTTISMVVDDVLEIYRKRVKQAEELIEGALTALYPGSRPVRSLNDVNDSTIVVDPLRLDRTNDVVILEDGIVTLNDSSEGDGKATVSQTTNSDAKAYEKQGKFILENGDFKMTMSEGRIVSLVDVQLDRELILAGPGAQDGGLTIYEDYPIEWDAWDVEVYHLDSYKALQFQEIKPSVSGGRATLTATAKFGQSTAVLKVIDFLLFLLVLLLKIYHSSLLVRLQARRTRVRGHTSGLTRTSTGTKNTESSNASQSSAFYATYCTD
jgi:alpha-mannosidase